MFRNSRRAQNRKILIAYGSSYGSTGGIADAIKNELGDHGAQVETKPIKNVTNLQQYDAVIIGSPIQYDRWVPEAREFVTSHQCTLEQMPVIFFFSCMALSLQTEKSKRQGQIYSDYLLTAFPRVKPLAIGQFAGALDTTRMSILLRLVFRIIIFKTGVKERDYRDWNAIRTWAIDIESKLSYDAN